MGERILYAIGWYRFCWRLYHRLGTYLEGGLPARTDGAALPIWLDEQIEANRADPSRTVKRSARNDGQVVGSEGAEGRLLTDHAATGLASPSGPAHSDGLGAAR